MERFLHYFYNRFTSPIRDSRCNSARFSYIILLSWGEDNVFLNEVVNYPDNLGVEEILRSIYNSSIEGQLSLEIERDLLESEIEELRNLGYHIILKDKYTVRNLIQWSIRPSL